MKQPTRKNLQQGAAAVEFAVILPMLLLLVFGGIEFGLVMFNKQVITNASREAARAGIVMPDADGNRLSDANIISIALNYCTNFLVTFDPASPPPSVTLTYAGQATGENLTVDVSYPYQFLLVPNLQTLFGTGVGQNLTIEASTTMRYE